MVYLILVVYRCYVETQSFLHHPLSPRPETNASAFCPGESHSGPQVDALAVQAVVSRDRPNMQSYLTRFRERTDYAVWAASGCARRTHRSGWPKK